MYITEERRMRETKMIISLGDWDGDNTNRQTREIKRKKRIKLMSMALYMLGLRVLKDKKV